MTTIGSINPSNLEKKELKAPENEVKKQPLFNSAQTNATPDPSQGQAQTQGPLKAYQIDYSIFKKDKIKSEAASHAEVALEQVKTLVDDYNNSFPQNQYIVKYDEFPKPADFAQFGKEAYNRWKSELDNWVDNIRNELKDKKSYNMQNLTNTMAAGFSVLGAQLGFSTEFIAEKLEELNGDVTKLNRALKETQNAIIKNANANAEDIMSTIVATYIAEMNYETNIANGLHDHIDDSTQELEGDIKDVKNTVIRQSSIEQANVVRTAKHIEDTVKLTAEQTQELDALSGSIDLALNNNYNDNKQALVTEFRDRILSEDNSLTFERKKECLNKIKDLVCADEKITRDILQETLNPGP